MLRLPLSKRSLVVLGAAFLLTGCPDPDARYDEYVERSEAQRNEGAPDFGPPPAVDEGRQDLTGTFLFALATELDPGKPLMFRADVTIDGVGADEQTLDMNLVPLTSWCAGAFCAADDPSRWAALEEAVIEPDPVAYVDDADGTFVIDFGEIRAPGPSNPISGSEILASLLLFGQTRGPDAFCGQIEGALTAPFPFALDRTKNNFGAVRVGEGEDLASISPVGSCP